MLRAFGGGTLFGVRYGDTTPTVLALHGWNRTSADFSDVFGDQGLKSNVHAPIEERSFSAVALDLAGFGSTPAPPTAWGSAEYAVSLDLMLEEMGERIILVGHSFGGRVALHVASRHRSRIAGIVLTGVPLLRLTSSTPRVAWRYRTVRFLRAMKLVSPVRLEDARSRYGSSDYREAKGVMRDVLVRVLSEDYSELMKAMDVPVELVWGADDEVVPKEVGTRATTVFPQSRLTFVKGCGHLLPSTSPEALRDAIGRLLL